MANPQPDQFTKLSNELYEAIMKTDFSKRQRSIIDLIIRLSYGCRKKSAVLRSSDFELVGVLRGHIKKELDYLQMVNVLQIDGEIFALNKNYDTWRIGISKGFNQEKYQKVLGRNLQNVTETVTKVTETVTNPDDEEVTEIVTNVTETVTKVTETVTNPDDEEVTEIVTNVTETVTKVTEMVTDDQGDFQGELPKQEQGCYQNSNSDVTKTVTGTTDEPLSGAASGAPKDIIKDSIKDIKEDTEELITKQDTEPSSTTKTDFSFSRMYQIYEQHFAKDGKITDLEVEDLIDQFDTFGGEWLLDAMREAVRQNKRSLAYINGILQGYKSRGGTQRENKAIVPAGIGNPDGKPNRQQLQNELAAQKIREAEARERERDQENFYADPERL
ncbi:replication protein [Paenibacillus sp. GYB004]|uniref:replication protein n=1 Tax=Paenibacillus sp. GYB004 TaxID=2994393 RepID=UPI002F963D81